MKVAANCPLCKTPAQIFDLPQYDSQDVECPKCKMFRIANGVWRYIEENPTAVADVLLRVSRAAAASKKPLVIGTHIDIADIARDQQAAENLGNT